jgi:hypothetical protein
MEACHYLTLEAITTTTYLFDDGSTLVDYESEEPSDNRASNDDGFEVDLSEHPDYLEQDEAKGNEQTTTLCERYEHEIDYRLWDIGSSKSL